MARPEVAPPGEVIVLDSRAVTVAGRCEGATMLVEPAGLAGATGWELKPEGLCRDEVCVPTRGRAGLRAGEAVDLAAMAEVLGRPLALDTEEGVAVLGESAGQRRQAMESLVAPDVTLADLDGRPVSLSSFAGRKWLLLAWASW